MLLMLPSLNLDIWLAGQSRAFQGIICYGSGLAASSGTLLSCTMRNLYRRACESGSPEFSDSTNFF